jgi:hypothetical protein
MGNSLTRTSAGIGTMRVDAVSTEWVETKTLNFTEAVLKAD